MTMTVAVAPWPAMEVPIPWVLIAVLLQQGLLLVVFHRFPMTILSSLKCSNSRKKLWRWEKEIRVGRWESEREKERREREGGHRDRERGREKERQRERERERGREKERESVCVYVCPCNIFVSNLAGWHWAFQQEASERHPVSARAANVRKNTWGHCWILS